MLEIVIKKKKKEGKRKEKTKTNHKMLFLLRYLG